MFKIKILENSFHSDIYVISLLNNYGVVLDSYHLANDESDRYSNLSGYEKVFIVLENLFEVWIEIIEKGNGYLILDFSDQYIGGISIRESNGRIELRYAYSEQFYGWDSDIISIANAQYSDDSFEIDKNFSPIFIDKHDLINNIKDTLIVPIRQKVIYKCK